MQTSTTHGTEAAQAQLFHRSMHELAGLLGGLEPTALINTGCVEADGVRFYFQHHPDDELPCVSVLAEVGDIPHDAEAEFLRQLLEANAQLRPKVGTYAIVPGSSRLALRLQVPLRDDEANGDRILAVLLGHIAACTAIRHMDVDLGADGNANVGETQAA